MPEAKVKNFGLIPLAEETSKLLDNGSLPWTIIGNSNLGIDSLTWLLVVILMKIYSENEKADQGKL